MATPADAAKQTLSPELAELARQFERIKDDGRELVAGLTESQFNWRPEPSRWSISECLLHLNITGDRWMPLVEQAIASARARGLQGRGPLRYGRLGSFLVRHTEPPVKLRLKAPGKLIPAPGNPVTAVVPTFLHLQDQFIQQLRQAAGLDLSRAPSATPISKLLKLNLAACFAQIAAHQRRHLWQAREVRQDPQFPPPGPVRGRPLE